MERNPYSDVFEADDPEELYEPPGGGRARWGVVGVCIALALALMLVWESFRAPPMDTAFNLQVEGEIAYAYGTTDEFSYANVETVLDAHPELTTIVLRNVPGTVHLGDNVQIARLIRHHRLNTHLERDSFIASGGVDLFLGGVERTMECGARIGVHTWQGEDGSTPKKLGFDPLEKEMQAFHAELGASPDFYPFTRDSSPHQALYYLQRDQIEKFGLLTEPGCEKVGWFG